LVRLAEERETDLAGLDIPTMQTVEPRITEDIYSVLTPAASAASRTSHGGTAPDQVRAAIARARTRFLDR
jgi:argininosuccinate lyase